MALSRAEQLKAEFTEIRGYWSPVWDGVLELDPDFFQAYLRFSSVPWKSGPLEPKVKELIYLAIDVATTHLFAPGIKIHLENALRLGASQSEIMEVFELTSVLGIHSCTVGVPILLEELAAATGDVAGGLRLGEREAELKEDFIRVRGYWSELWEGVLALDADFFEAYFKFSAVPVENGTLEPKVRELIYVAIDAATTHLFEPGLRIHIRNALREGATAHEVMEVFELTSVLGIHTCAVGVPMLIEAARQNGALPWARRS
jgi:alkylhydroperoxidase/carboxymuconolactone decarboxylase family protein YurZ